MNDAERILKRLDEKEKDFLFAFLEEDSIQLNEILKTGSIKESVLKLKSEYKEIESSKVTKIEEVYSTQRNFVTGKTGRPKVKKTLTIEGKTPKEVEQVLTRQKRIGKVIPLLKKKILPELKIYEKLNSIEANSKSEAIERFKDKDGLLFDEIFEVAINSKEGDKFSAPYFSEKIAERGKLTIEQSSLNKKLKDRLFYDSIKSLLFLKIEKTKSKEDKAKLESLNLWIYDIHNSKRNKIEKPKSRKVNKLPFNDELKQTEAYHTDFESSEDIDKDILEDFDKQVNRDN